MVIATTLNETRKVLSSLEAENMLKAGGSSGELRPGLLLLKEENCVCAV